MPQTFFFFLLSSSLLLPVHCLVFLILALLAAFPGMTDRGCSFYQFGSVLLFKITEPQRHKELLNCNLFLLWKANSTEINTQEKSASATDGQELDWTDSVCVNRWTYCGTFKDYNIAYIILYFLYLLLIRDLFDAGIGWFWGSVGTEVLPFAASFGHHVGSACT